MEITDGAGGPPTGCSDNSGGPSGIDNGGGPVGLDGGGGPIGG